MWCSGEVSWGDAGRIPASGHKKPDVWANCRSYRMRSTVPSYPDGKLPEGQLDRIASQLTGAETFRQTDLRQQTPHDVPVDIRHQLRAISRNSVRTSEVELQNRVVSLEPTRPPLPQAAAGANRPLHHNRSRTP